MSLLSVITAVATSLAGLLKLDERSWKRLTNLVAKLTRHGQSKTSYENMDLSIALELCDVAGKRAVVRRIQRVRFLTEETGVVRDVVWGEGDSLAGYRVSGAEQLSVRREGSKKVVLLGLPTNPGTGEEMTFRTERIIKGGFEHNEAYLEASVERPTRRLTLSVFFPRDRPPTSARIEASPPAVATRARPVRLDARGRAHISWSLARPRLLVTYRLRWSW